MNVDKYKVDVSFSFNVPANEDRVVAVRELETYQEAVVGTLTDMFPGETVRAIPKTGHSSVTDVSYEVVFGDGHTHWMGDCERILRQLRKSDAVFYARVEAWLFHDGPSRLRLGDVPQDRSAWIVVGMGKYYFNEHTTVETILPTSYVTTLMSYATEGADSVYASKILHEAMRSNPAILAQPDMFLHVYRYGEPHEVNLRH